MFFLLLVLFHSLTDPSASQPGFPQNIETFYPTPTPSPSPAPSSSSSPSPSPSTSLLLTPPPPPHYASAQPPPSDPSKKSIVTTIGVTAASTFVLAALVFIACSKYAHARRRKDSASKGDGGGGRNTSRVLPALPLLTEFSRFDGNVKGLIVDEDGLDVLYWRKLEGSKKNSLRKEPLDRAKRDGVKPATAIPRGQSSSSSSSPNTILEKGDFNNPPPSTGSAVRINGGGAGGFPSSSSSVVQLANQKQPRELNLLAVPRALNNTPPPLAPSSAAPETRSSASSPSPPPPPPLLPPPPVPKKKTLTPPPPPPKPGGSGSSSKTPPPPPPGPKPSAGGSKTLEVVGEERSGNGKKDQVKLKPLHWEKVNVNTDHSMVWDKLDRGSFQYNGDMMEALFGVVATNRKSFSSSPKQDENSSNKTGIGEGSSRSAKIFILDPRKSQNAAIVLRSLGVPRSELIDSLHDGRGLTSETLEKLTRIALTREEQSEILEFEGDPTRLADAEYFLYRLLKAVPDAFAHANAMLFRSSYDSEMLSLKDSLTTLESACNELRSRGIFLKLLEAILKAGNRLNAGTVRGDAKGFNLTTLLKLSDYKSSDGKTTLLHFVVHEVVRNEGRRCVLARNSSSQSSLGRGSSSASNAPMSKEVKEKEFLKLGLPIVGGLSAEFSSVKKAATIDHDALSSTLASLGRRILETRQLVAKCGAVRNVGGFVVEMTRFLATAEVDIEQMKEESMRVMELVKKTTQYYQAGALNDKNLLQLFVIVRDFLGMVDQACVEIARCLQQKKPASAGSSSSSGEASQQSEVLRTRVTFPKLPDHFLWDKSSSTTASSEDSIET